MREYDLIIIGGGASGIICAIEAYKKGIKNILLIEKDNVLGGSLNLSYYNISKQRYITGKTYEKFLLKELEKCEIDIKLDTMVIKIEDENKILCTNPANGIEKIKGKNIILANGAKEGSRKALDMVGDRCSGILTVGMANKILNMGNIVPGKNILIYDKKTLYMIKDELKNRNINVVGIISKDSDVDTYGLTDKVYNNYEIDSIYGEGRIESVKLVKDDKEEIVKCDTLIFARPMLSDGLVAMRSNIKLNPSTTGPEVNDKFMTSMDNVYACGNGIYIHEYIEDIEDECKKLVDNLL
ncbi:FAD-dependent oxidoreductase [Romboutsia hominis]|uniref:Pyridine nucleotide-disulphide oxidoreductase n=2 Tax=Romboutsia TaxID=1501226 RepID=A0A2P2BRX6_9FIRM|nr:FAD-dependent oxidoreductase [Romboutsia hominis]MCH1960406.1 NAD(P)/FAD-dependent oxidoreductase [Romboutsia hominis]MCH1969164.1 NAD(P)/FAD-dependent oxidoreductase [Romboutsia hominis]CEI73119.1 Pyridine nucleotide-disulphide oxidoreductase [Romboutsia hominis]